MKLSKRLQAIADLIENYKQGQVLADIGSDHAYLPCYLVDKGIITKAYACDIASGPINASIETIKLYQLEKNVIPLLGSGMNPILDKDVDMISICGMGGKLIVDILDEHSSLLKNHRFIIQANIGLDVLREYLSEKKMKILDEVLVKDAHHIYEVIVCEYDSHLKPCSEEDMIFGPVLRKKKGLLFDEKWKYQLSLQEKIIVSLNKEHPRYKEVKHMIEMIEGELK